MLQEIHFFVSVNDCLFNLPGFLMDEYPNMRLELRDGGENLSTSVALKRDWQSL